MVHSNSQTPVRPVKQTVKFVSITTTKKGGKGGTNIRFVHHKGLHKDSKIILDATNKKVNVKYGQHKWMPEDDRRLMAVLKSLNEERTNPPIELIDKGFEEFEKEYGVEASLDSLFN
jgi:hypothetical protein